jgi:hypothetical protein
MSIGAAFSENKLFMFLSREKSYTSKDIIAAMGLMKKVTLIRDARAKKKKQTYNEFRLLRFSRKIKK